MPYNVLIDTNHWKKLVSALGDDRNLPPLKNWLAKKEIIIYIPLELQEEWKKHRLLEILEMEKMAERHLKDLKKRNLFQSTANYESTALEYARKELLKQIETIDWIFANSRHIPDDSRIANLIRNKKKEDKPPFHKKNKKDNENDAYILYATLEYLTENKEQELYFVSHDTNAFSSLRDNDVLHNDISDAYSDLEIHYFTQMNGFVKDMQARGLSPENIVKDKWAEVIRNDVEINRLSHPLDQLHQLLTEKFQEFNFLPRRFFCRQFPFIVADTYNFHDWPFHANTDNKILFDLLQKIIISGDEIVGLTETELEGCDNYEIKIQEIYQLLSFSFVHGLYFQLEQRIPIYFYNTDLSHLLITRLRELRFPEVFSFLKANNISDLQTILEIAYIRYKMRDYTGSAEIYFRVYEKALAASQKTTAYIAGYSLTKLAAFISTTYYNEPDKIKLVDKINQIDPNVLFSNGVAEKDVVALQWLGNKDFLESSTLRLHEITAAIRSNFHNKNGGWNIHKDELLNVYLEAEYFLTYNYIVYDNFKEFQDLTNVFVEGIYASHGCSASLGGRMEIIGDWLIEIFLWQATPESLKENLRRYNLKELKSEEKDVLAAAGRIISLLENYSAVIREHAECMPAVTRRLTSVYIPMISTGITLLAQLSMSDDLINAIAAAILEFIKNPAFEDDLPVIKAIEYFFIRTYKKIGLDIIREVYRLFLFGSFFKASGVTDTLAQLLSKRNADLTLTSKEFGQFKNKWLISDPGKRLDMYEFDIISDIFSLTGNRKQKHEIRQYFSATLHAHFSHQIFYRAAIFGMLKNDSFLFEKYTAVILEIAKGGVRNRAYPEELFYTDIHVDGYLNYCFKNKITIDSEIKAAIQKLGIYYQWLLDLNNFNYTDFSPDWLKHHFTKYFKFHLRKSQKLKAHVLSILPEIKDDALMKTIAYIFIYKSLDK